MICVLVDTDTQEELRQHIAGQAGLMAHLGTTDVRVVLNRIKEGDNQANFILEAMIYNVAKFIGAAATVLKGDIDAILLTGGIAYSDYVISLRKNRISFLAPIIVYPDENGMKALAQNAIAVLNGKQKAKKYK